MSELRRPNTIEELMELFSRSGSGEENDIGNTFNSVDSDVFISTYAKSGTTWMQQVVHQVRSAGDEQYNDIYEVVPWLEMAKLLKTDPEESQPGGFRAFKTHLPYDGLPKPGRYISVFREPKSVIPSFYRFLGGWYFETDGVSLDEFGRRVYLDKPAGHANHFTQWYKRVGKPDTLLLCYEDMVQKPEQVPQLVADFLGLTLAENVKNKIIQQCSRAYMVEHESKFGDRLVRMHQDHDLGLPPDGDSSKVYKDEPNETLDAAFISDLDTVWSETVGKALGFRNYSELRDAMPNPLQAERP